MASDPWTVSEFLNIYDSDNTKNAYFKNLRNFFDILS
jgi:hypothetical protein